MKVKTEIRWPKPGDEPFLVGPNDPDSPTWASLDWLRAWNVDDSILSEAFKNAANRIIDDLKSEASIERPDLYFLPIAFLYRHCLELKMKQIILLANRLDLIEKNKKLDDALNAHNLCNLWNPVKKAIIEMCPPGLKQDISSAERIIQAFHNVDKSGQNFRYTKDSSGQSTLGALPESLELTHLQDVFEAIWNFLDGCEIGMDEALRNSGP